MLNPFLKLDQLYLKCLQFLLVVLALEFGRLASINSSPSVFSGRRATLRLSLFFIFLYSVWSFVHPRLPAADAPNNSCRLGRPVRPVQRTSPQAWRDYIDSGAYRGKMFTGPIKRSSQFISNCYLLFFRLDHTMWSPDENFRPQSLPARLGCNWQRLLRWWGQRNLLRAAPRDRTAEVCPLPGL